MSATADYFAILRTLRMARIKSGKSQTEIGARCGVSNQAISAWETAAAMPKADHLIGWADALGFTLTLEPKGMTQARKPHSSGAPDVSPLIG